MATFINVLKIAVVVYLAVLILMYLLQERFIFFAQPITNPYVKRFSEYEVTFKHEEATLHGWFIKKTNAKKSPMIIYYGGNAEEVSGNLLDLKSYPEVSLLFMNYRGYGKSTGKPTEKKLVKDALFILDEMVSKEEIDLKNVILMGRSLGSGVAVQVASQRHVGGVILVTPFDSLVNVAKSNYPVFPVKWLIRHPFKSAEQAVDINIPALSIMGIEDRIIPNNCTNALVKAWKGQIRSVAIEQADHNNIHLFPRYWAATNDFLNDLEF